MYGYADKIKRNSENQKHWGAIFLNSLQKIKNHRLKYIKSVIFLSWECDYFAAGVVAGGMAAGGLLLFQMSRRIFQVSPSFFQTTR